MGENGVWKRVEETKTLSLLWFFHLKGLFAFAVAIRPQVAREEKYNAILKGKN